MKLLSSGNVYKNFILMAIPLVLAGLLSQAFGMIDTVIVGKMIGENAVAALGATYSLIELISSVFWGLGTGSSLYIATLYGSGDKERLTNTIKLTLSAYFILSMAIGAGMIVFAKPIFAFLRVDAAIYDEAMSYYIIYIAGLAPILMNNTACYVFHALGNSAFPLVMSVTSSIVNIVGNILFVLYTPLGVAGVAISTVISAVLVCILYIIKLTATFKKLGCKARLHIDTAAILECLRYGVPCMLQQMSMYLSSFAVSPIVNALGSTATAGYTVGMRIYSINASIFQNSSKCVSNYSAQCMGARLYGKIGTGIRAGLLQALILSLPFAVACYLFPEPIATFFFNNDCSPQSIEIACMFMTRCIPFIAFSAFNNLFHSLFKGVKAMKSVVVCTASYTLARITASFILSPRYGMGGIYAALSAAWVVETAVICTIYFSGVWKSSELKAYELEASR